MRSYAAIKLGPLGRLNELRKLYRWHTRQGAAQVRALLDEARRIERVAQTLRNAPLDGARVLEIGVGQCQAQLAYFAIKCETVGIDLDVIADRLTPAGCARMLLRNGPIRTAKTIARRGLGIDARLAEELRRQLGPTQRPAPRIMQMDASKMSFPNASFDLAFSRAVFEHLSDPAAVLGQIRRVLRPGGVAFIILHLYTSDTGCHDARLLTGSRGGLPFWPHLRPQFQHLVRPNAYLNRWRLEEWRDACARELPGSVVRALCDADEATVAGLRDLRATGECAGFADEELLSVTVEITWVAP